VFLLDSERLASVNFLNYYVIRRQVNIFTYDFSSQFESQHSSDNLNGRVRGPNTSPDVRENIPFTARCIEISRD
jgi:hypothetical protein